MLLASSDSDKHNEAKSLNKDSPTSNLHILVKQALLGVFMTSFTPFVKHKFGVSPPLPSHCTRHAWSIHVGDVSEMISPRPCDTKCIARVE